MTDVRVWRGIRFAEPPVGPLRWQAPVPFAGRATPDNTFGAASWQHRSPLTDLGDGAALSEDCLTLNIWAPVSATTDHPLPVMVWIHGGAYVAGSGRAPAYDGTALAREGVVVVTVNYRLGALGWLDLPGLGPTNLGLRDVLAALTWVRESIHGFGGDDANVTVFGESAGAGIITSLLASPEAAGSFDAAIAESSPATTVATRDMGADTARRLLADLGVSAGDLREIAPEQILDAAMRVDHAVPTERPGHLAWAPTVGDDLLDEDPARVLHRGAGLPVPLLIGTNRDESRAFAHSQSPLLPVTDTGLAALLAEVKDAHPAARTPAVAQGRRAHLDEATQASFRMPAVWIADGHSTVAPTRLYRFDHATPALRLAGLDAAHATEVPYVFGTMGARPHDPMLRFGGGHDAARISARVRERWTTFARDRSAAVADAPIWPVYDTAHRPTLVIDAQDTVVDDIDAAARELWGDEVLDLETTITRSAGTPPPQS